MKYNNPYHSLELRNRFNIQRNGVDYQNDYNIKVEFKETVQSKDKIDSNNVFFKIEHNQLFENDIIVFCINSENIFYVHKAKTIKNKFYHKNNCKKTTIRINNVRKNYIFKTDNYNDLEQFIKNIRSV